MSTRGVGIVAGAVVALFVSASAEADHGAIHDRAGEVGYRAANYGPKLHDLDRELPSPGQSPIRHVVIIYQENHSFDNVFGRLCARTGACDGATVGTLPDGSTIPLRRSPDIVPKVAHGTEGMKAAIDRGRMDGFATINGCRPQESPPMQRYGCFTQFTQDQIPNLWKLARSFAISDRTFQLGSVPSYGAHLELMSTTDYGFINNPVDSPDQAADGWGCDSHLDAWWQATIGSPVSLQPACIPWYGLNPDRYPYGGAYRSTQVQPAPTMMDRLDKANLSWKLYAGARARVTCGPSARTTPSASIRGGGRIRSIRERCSRTRAPGRCPASASSYPASSSRSTTRAR